MSYPTPNTTGSSVQRMQRELARDMVRGAPAIIKRAAPAFSLSRVLSARMDGQHIDGFEREVIDEAANFKGSGDQYCSTVCIPFAALAPQQRGLSSATPAAGGNLIATSVASAIEVLTPYSVAARVGYDIRPGLTANMGVPAGSTSEDRRGTWMSFETPSIAKHVPRTGLATLQPHTWGQIIDYSTLLVRQGPMADEYLRRRLLTAAGQAIDLAVLGDMVYGTTAGRPLGLLEIEGTQRYSPTAGNEWVDGVGLAQEYVTLRSGSDFGCNWIGGATMRRLLQSSGVSQYDGPVWTDADRVAGRPAHCSGAMSPLSIAYGDFSKAVLGLFGAGIELEIDPYTGFKNLTLSMRALVTLDVVYPDPSSYAIVTRT